MITDEAKLQERYEALFPILDEQQRRLLAAADAKSLGHGGVSKVARASGLSRPTIDKGIQGLEEGAIVEGRVRRPGGGRKRLSEQDPAILEALESLVDPVTRGDPMSPLRWTCKSTRQLAELLEPLGYPISQGTVGALLHQLGYSLQAQAKSLEGTKHPDRDEQFQYINAQVKAYLKKKLPVISVDAKKKE